MDCYQVVVMEEKWKILLHFVIIIIWIAFKLCDGRKKWKILFLKIDVC
jgi:hypothetical protein